MRNISFSEDAWKDYLYWQLQDKKTLKKINLKDRLVYKITDEAIIVIQCKGHYSYK